ncbi:MAG: CHAT domain-containing protein [Bacteroidetes bacterium]|nr:CHAT domain-containing protein [Bacteroidota bacterium]
MDYLFLARYYKEMPNRNDSCYYWASRALICAKSDKAFSFYSLPRIYNLLGYYYHPASVAYFDNKDSLSMHFRISRLYYDSALSTLAKQPIVDELMLARVYHNLGNSFSNEGDRYKALNYYRRGLRIYAKFGSPTELAAEDWVMGRAFERQRWYDSSLASFQNGIKRLVPDFDPRSLADLPVAQPTLNDMWYTSHVATKGNVFYQRYLAHHQLADLTAAYDHYVYLLKFNRYLVSRSLHEADQIRWSHLYGSNAYQLLVKTGYELSRRTGNQEYLQKVYGLIASAKYAFLNKAIMKPETSGSINRGLLREEQSVVIRNILRSTPQLSETELISILPVIPDNAEVTPSQVDLASHFDDTLTYKTLKSELSSEEAALIDFYLNNDALYTVVITGDKFDIIKTAFSDNNMSLLIRKVRKNLLRMSPEEYAIVSNEIYKSTLDSALMQIPEGITRLIISPDGMLQEIGWDALVRETTRNTAFKNLHYLVHDYTIRTVMTPVQITKVPNDIENQFYGIAPDFQHSKRFSEIPFSTALAVSRAQELEGTLDQTVTRESIEANIVHITSHVSMDPMHPYNSAIHLGETDSLTVGALSSMKIKANVIVLNGCQTGNGQYVPSEGTMSIARAFYLLGAASVVTTLWSVDDKSTADVLRIWYDKIEDGEELDIALRKAKLDFIRNAGSDDTANPFYWAGLQLTGSSKSIMQTKRTTYLIGLGVLLLALSLISILLKQRQRWKSR